MKIGDDLRRSRKFGLWQEYPQKDPEYVRWYPPGLEPLCADDLGDVKPKNRKLEKIAFYIHVPFCLSVCKYCPFTRGKLEPEAVASYLEALEQEITGTVTHPYFGGTNLSAGYFGGGTPTTLSIKQLEVLAKLCRRSFNIPPGTEMTIEANPDTVDREKLQALSALGFNRISFGVQSFEGAFLETIGRIHTPGQAQHVVETAHSVGFDNICLDLLYKLPGQTLRDWQRDLRRAAALGVHHISTYCLYLPRGTLLQREAEAGHLPGRPGEREEEAMCRMAEEELQRAGFIRYTAYDYARPGKECRHHAVNWQAPQGEYYGFGPGAFSHNRNHIYCNVAGMESYVHMIGQQKPPVALGKKISRQERMCRFMVLGLKYLKVAKRDFRETFGEELDEIFSDALDKLENWGLIVNGREEVRVTEHGKLYIGNVCKAFYSDESRLHPQPRPPVDTPIWHRDVGKNHADR